MIRIVAFLFSGGDAFFIGLAVLITAVVAGLARTNRWAGALLDIGGVLAWILLIASGTPLPFWFYAIGGGLTVLCLVPGRSPIFGWTRETRINGLTLLVVGWSLAAAGWEAAYRLPPKLNAETSRYRALAVIGDSISAGMLGSHELTWPKQFRDRFHTEVIDLSQPGATARSALQQAQKLNADHSAVDAVVLIEIGGNDYFESRSPKDFAVDLDRLLTELTRPNRLCVMLELPLPPFFNAYGRVQRTLAAKHHVPLISKREFARVVFSPEATLDTVHLSELGHARMAEMIWHYIGRKLQSDNRSASR